MFGLAFLIATFTQLQAAFTRNFHYDMKDDLPRWFMWVLVVTGMLHMHERELQEQGTLMRLAAAMIHVHIHQLCNSMG